MRVKRLYLWVYMAWKAVPQTTLTGASCRLRAPGPVQSAPTRMLSSVRGATGRRVHLPCCPRPGRTQAPPGGPPGRRYGTSLLAHRPGPTLDFFFALCRKPATPAPGAAPEPAQASLPRPASGEMKAAGRVAERAEAERSRQPGADGAREGAEAGRGRGVRAEDLLHLLACQPAGPALTVQLLGRLALPEPGEAGPGELSGGVYLALLDGLLEIWKDLRREEEPGAEKAGARRLGEDAGAWRVGDVRDCEDKIKKVRRDSDVLSDNSRPGLSMVPASSTSRAISRVVTAPETHEQRAGRAAM
jgi:hypothetical protein